MFYQRRTMEDVGPILYKCYTNVCLRGRPTIKGAVATLCNVFSLGLCRQDLV